jgi:hypothetical protein
MRQFAEGFPFIFVDSSELDPSFRLPSDVHPLAAACEAINEGGARPIPVTGLHRDDGHHAAALEVKTRLDLPICLRLDGTDVSTAKLSYNKIKNYLEKYRLDSGATYLLLDLQGLYRCDPDHEAAQVSRFLSIAEGSPWAGIIVGGYGIPEQIGMAIPTNSQGYVPRTEQIVFTKLERHDTSSPTWFADYTILPPSVVELDWRLIHRVMTPKAIYTLEDSWLVVRGGALSRHPDGQNQYYSIAQEIVALDEFPGAQFSFGDEYIAARAARNGTPGNAGSWITACVNHHITYTAQAHRR